ncbi:MAG: urea transporter [Planctomycetes bacterium]|nr:urea transporter [Planctomycetota bacterium]
MSTTRTKIMAAEAAACMRAYGQVLFSSDWRVGSALFLMTLLQPASGVAGLLAVLAAHAVSAWIGYSTETRLRGAHGYNAALLGLFMVSGRDLGLLTATIVILAGMGSVPLMVVLSNRLYTSCRLPALILPFVILAVLLIPAMPIDGITLIPARSLLPDLSPLPDPAHGILKGLAAIYCRASDLEGLVILSTLVFATPIGAAMSVVGAALAVGMCRIILPEAGTEVETTCVYNSTLASLALGAALHTPGHAATLVAIFGSALCTLIVVGVTSFMNRVGLPILSAPFALVTLCLARSLQLRTHVRLPMECTIPGATPEANLELFLSRSRRFGIPGVPEFKLPMGSTQKGTWSVSQGVGGSHTHRGPWIHAWDFEIVDSRGFPFQDKGTVKEDYFSFGEQVLAPGSGTVVAVHDGVPDSAPSAVDTAHPWGNAIVLQHGAAFYSVVAHLKLGSILVARGQFVAAGQPIALCGSSGRSPRAHIHFQAQRTEELGAAAIPARFVHYRTSNGNGVQFIAFGCPVEGERISGTVGTQDSALATSLMPGATVNFVDANDACVLRAVSEISSIGERWLRDIDRGDRLHFIVNSAEVVFTAHTGNNSDPLRKLWIALSRFPVVVDATSWSWTDEPPAAAMLTRSLNRMVAPLRVVFDPLATRVEYTAVRQSDRMITIRGAVAFGVRARMRPRFESRVELDERGIRRLECLDLRLPSSPPFVLRRANSKPSANR